MNQQTVNVVYVGDKPSKHDNVAGTDTIWTGKDDVQPVPIKAWAKLRLHPGVWVLANETSRTDEQSGTGNPPGPDDDKPKVNPPAAKKAAKVQAPKATGEGAGEQSGTGNPPGPDA